MVRSVLHYENRISRLKASGEMKNINLIKKAEREMQRAKISGLASNVFEKILNGFNDVFEGKVSYDNFMSE